MVDQKAGYRRYNIRIFSVKEGIEGKNTLDRYHRDLNSPKPGVPLPADRMKLLALSGHQKLKYEGA